MTSAACRMSSRSPRPSTVAWPGPGERPDRRERAVDRLVDGAADGAADPVQERAHRLGIDGSADIARGGADHEIGEDLRDLRSVDGGGIHVCPPETRGRAHAAGRQRCQRARRRGLLTTTRAARAQAIDKPGRTLEQERQSNCPGRTSMPNKPLAARAGLALAGLVLAGAFADGASAEPAAYPHKVVTLVTHSSPGGGSDVFLREMAKHLGKYIDATFVVENVQGGSGARAMARLAAAQAGRQRLLRDDADLHLHLAPQQAGQHLSRPRAARERLHRSRGDLHARRRAVQDAEGRRSTTPRSKRGRWGAANPASLERMAAGAAEAGEPASTRRSSRTRAAAT